MSLQGSLSIERMCELTRVSRASFYRSFREKHPVEEEMEVRSAMDLAGIGGSALTDTSIAVPEQPTTGIPVTYVPARNTILLSLALGWAEVLGAEDVFVGVTAVDFSGYPDCRPAFIEAFSHLAALATKAGVEGHPCRVQAPLISWSKQRIIREGTRLGVDYSLTVSCYQADDLGGACGRCDSCRLRRAGFEAAGVPDPTMYRHL